MIMLRSWLIVHSLVIRDVLHPNSSQLFSAFPSELTSDKSAVLVRMWGGFGAKATNVPADWSYLTEVRRARIVCSLIDGMIDWMYNYLHQRREYDYYSLWPKPTWPLSNARQHWGGLITWGQTLLTAWSPESRTVKRRRNTLILWCGTATLWHTWHYDNVAWHYKPHRQMRRLPKAVGVVGDDFCIEALISVTSHCQTQPLGRPWFIIDITAKSFKHIALLKWECIKG